MARKIKRQNPLLADEETPEFQVAPMADVLFVLLVFFMSITCTEVIRSDKSLKLPVAKDGMEQNKKANQTVINVNWDADARKGKLKIDGIEFDDPGMVQISQLLANRLNANPMLRVLIRADQGTEFSYISGIMRQCSAAGIANVTFSVTTGEVQ